MNIYYTTLRDDDQAVVWGFNLGLSEYIIVVYLNHRALALLLGG